MDERADLMKKIAAYAFAAYDWNLYLDTHPQDTEAIKMFQKMTNTAKELKKEYEEKYGPITADMSSDTENWTWIDSPWPWEN